MQTAAPVAPFRNLHGHHHMHVVRPVYLYLYSYMAVAGDEANLGTKGGEISVQNLKKKVRLTVHCRTRCDSQNHAVADPCRRHQNPFVTSLTFPDQDLFVSPTDIRRYRRDNTYTSIHV